jgi:hypothetical protein
LDKQLVAALDATLGPAGKAAAAAAAGKGVASAPGATTDSKAVFSIQANGSSQPLAVKAQVRSLLQQNMSGRAASGLLLCRLMLSMHQGPMAGAVHHNQQQTKQAPCNTTHAAR